MTATRPLPAPIDGRFIRLEPLTDAHLPELWEAIGVPEVFAGGFGGGAAGLAADLAGFVDFAHRYFHLETANVYAARLRGGAHDGVLVGTSTLGDFDENSESAHIGWTAWDPRVWSTQVNPEAKLLMLGLAFESGFNRVKIQADAVNARSRGAIAGIGAQFEGIIRRERRRADGSWRDVAVYSILGDEWLDVRSRLLRRLDKWSDRPVELREPLDSMHERDQ